MLSANNLGIIDPLEEYEYEDRRRRPGYLWYLEEETAPPCVAFINHFDCTPQSLSTRYNGTIFRFPFRNHPNELSQTCYDSKRVYELFKTFKLDAQRMLLFLKNVQTVELCIRKKGCHKSESLFKISVSGQDAKLTLKRHHQEFLKKISSSRLLSDPEKTTYPITIEISDVLSGVIQTHKYLVSEYHAGGPQATHLRGLADDLSQRPLVGTAIELKPMDGHEPVGQISCFLPLPKQKGSSSGLPVHVNGYFSVSQNRRHIDWPSEGKKLTEDKSLQWNHALITELLPQSYTILIQETIHLHRQGQIKLSPADIMHMMPDPKIVRGHWNILMDPLYRVLLQQDVLYSEVRGGKWIKPQEAVLEDDTQTAEEKDTVNALLVQGGENIVKLPKYLKAVLDDYGYQPQVVSPAMVRQVLQNCPSVCHGLSRNKKLCVLQYILKDKNFSNLHEIPLLPLADGTFGVFMNPYCLSEVYVIKNKSQRLILQGLEKILMDDNLDRHLNDLLNELANTG